MNVKKINKKIVIGWAVISSLILSSIILYNKAVFVKESVKLSNDGNKLVWELKDKFDLKNKNFIVVRDNEVIYKTIDFTYTDTNIKDTAAPNSIKSFEVTYDKDNIKIKWDKPLDNGTQNTYQIFIVNNKNRKIAKSNIVKQSFSSGISKYVVDIKDIDKEIQENEINIPRKDITEGNFDVNVKVTDNKGNVSPVDKPAKIFNYTVKTEEQSDKINICINDNEQSYKYKGFVNDKEVNIQENTIKSDNFKDKVAPGIPNPQHSSNGDNTSNFKWEAVGDNASEYTYYVEGEGEKYHNKSYSKPVTKSVMAGTKGYYYKISSNSGYNVTDKDTFISNTFLNNINLPEGTYYFHIASVDNNNNISYTKHVKFSVLNQHKLNMISSILFKEGSLSEAQANIEKNELYKLSEMILQKLIDSKLKVYVMNSSLISKYHELTGSTEGITGDIEGFYYIWNNTIYVSTKYPTESTLHEIGHYIDINFVFPQPSYRGEFTDIYNAEKYKLCPNSPYLRSTSEEYFAEAVRRYYDNENMNSISPRTYNFVNSIINNIK